MTRINCYEAISRWVARLAGADTAHTSIYIAVVVITLYRETGEKEMKTYFKLVVTALILLVNAFVVLPQLTSAANDYAVGLGGLDFVLMIPIGWYLGRWVANDFLTKE